MNPKLGKVHCKEEGTFIGTNSGLFQLSYLSFLFYYHMNIYIGNLNYNVKDEELEELFNPFGQVQSVKVIRDFNTGRSRGFAFVEIENEEGGLKAIEELNESEFLDRKIIVNRAREKGENG